jgi:hypothetical protein
MCNQIPCCKKFVKIDIQRKINKNMKVYYARPFSLYNTKQDERDILTLRTLGFDVVNPNKEELQLRYKTEGMDAFLQAIDDCNLLAFRSFQDGKISAGVMKEIEKAQSLLMPISNCPQL